MRALLTTVLLAALLAGCGNKAARPDPARPIVVTPAPAVVAVPVRTYVQIEPRLTQRCPWVKNGTLEQVLDVSRGRKRCLEFYEANLGEIEQVQGTPAGEGSP
ncbi:hypothetical protein [Xanthomonas vesicatoria]|uniref:hypothetical protein n=1 Tax=Xanthomonas vesicatoria TaxID=56460 RepID=UPI000732327A|nr:hypothetical protein [Xanthomonas vesicatoria]KTF31787.1 hypothetical protein LMG919_18925 [Xanthomonas vesicatoria]MCC8559297.1 hypothetical protein [Xanthomonas vesicatoria]MCC8601170.1 hypothetical protein [Xanthomonas vesicatoria]MCC8608389.1 hypothetical protein [Xanthomonas vesicatoria]MCC8673813.1 hypothetical protein [Xanthomonas vesicatoria]